MNQGLEAKGRTRGPYDGWMESTRALEQPRRPRKTNHARSGQAPILSDILCLPWMGPVTHPQSFVPERAAAVGVVVERAYTHRKKRAGNNIR